MKKLTTYRDLLVCILVILAGGSVILRAQDVGTIIPLVGVNVEEFHHVAFSKDGSKVLAVSQGPLRVWNAKTGELIITLDSIAFENYSSANFSPDGTKIVATGNRIPKNESGEFENLIQIFDVKTGAEIRRLYGHPTIAREACYINDGKDIISFGEGEDYKLYIWDTESGELKKTIQVPNFTYNLSISSDEKYIAAIRNFWTGEAPRWYSSIRIIDLATGDSLKEAVFLDSTVLDVKWVNNSEDLAVCMYKNLEGFRREFIPLRIVNIWTGEVLRTYDYPDAYAGIVDVSSSGMIAVSTGQPPLFPLHPLEMTPQVNVWMGASTGQPVTYKTSSIVTSITFSPNGDQVAFTRLYGDTAYVWNFPAISDAPVTGNIDRDLMVTCMPNPASSELVISYQLSSPSVVRMSLVDAIGSTVSVLVDKTVESGSHRISVKVDDLVPGIYYCYAQKDGQVSVCPIHVVR